MHVCGVLLYTRCGCVCPSSSQLPERERKVYLCDHLYVLPSSVLIIIFRIIIIQILSLLPISRRGKSSFQVATTLELEFSLTAKFVSSG